MSENNDQKSGGAQGRAPDSGSAFYRPKTRGEMRDKLKEGVSCEVVSSNVGITLTLMDSLDLLRRDGFSTRDHCTVRDSKNKGWSVFVPND